MDPMKHIGSLVIETDARLPEWAIMAQVNGDFVYVAEGIPLPAGTTRVICHPDMRTKVKC